MIGTITKIQAGESGEEYGRIIWPVGSVNGDTLQDWIISHVRCDTLIGFNNTARFPREILLYRGVPGALPAVSSGVRLGPSELGSETTVLGSADWDADGHIDLLLKFHIYGDTSFGLHNGGWVNHLAVFWGNSEGSYSLNDTTNLVSERGGWGNIEASLCGDFDQDGTADVLIWDPFGEVISNGQPVKSPKMSMFTGQSGRRWGHDGRTRTASWVWWDPPIRKITHMSFIDQDCNGRRDICMFQNSEFAIHQVSVLYSEIGMVDTASAQTISVENIDGRFALFSDVSGDGTVDLVVNCGGNEVIRIYAGRPGQRLLDQYRSGNEGVTEGNGHWRRPWAEIYGPYKIHDGWSPTGYQTLYDLGDIQGPGSGSTASEIWTYSRPFLVCYSGGLFLDSLIDATFDIRPGTEIASAVRLGDIDGSGVPTIAVQYDEIPHAGTDAFPGGIAFIKARQLVPPGSGRSRMLPHIPGEACARISTVPPPDGRSHEFNVDVLPTPSSGDVRLRWNPIGLSGDLELSLSDASGSMVLHRREAASVGEIVITANMLASGEYFGTVRAGAATASIRIVVPW